jgi:hypothetical protein
MILIGCKRTPLPCKSQGLRKTGWNSSFHPVFKAGRDQDTERGFEEMNLALKKEGRDARLGFSRSVWQRLGLCLMGHIL